MKTDFMRFKQKGDISTVIGKPLKLVDQLIYLDSNISSSESDVNIPQAKAWTVIYKLSIIWKLDLSNEIKQDFYQVVIHHVDANKTHREKSEIGNTQEYYELSWTNPGNHTSQNSSCTNNCLPSHKPFK